MFEAATPVGVNPTETGVPTTAAACTPAFTELAPAAAGWLTTGVEVVARDAGFA